MRFPKDFVWGVATSSLQIEGGQNDGRKESIWDAFCETPGKVYDNHSPELACRSYEMLAQDLGLLADLGVGGYRFSVAWPRVMPHGTGVPNETGLSYYDRLVDGLLERGVNPWVTLYHWDLPLAIHHRGGWLNRDIAAWFADYVAIVVDQLSDRVQHWVTINEPSIFLGMGYFTGEHAPGLKLPRADVLQATHHALLAHGLATQVIRARAKKPATVGWAPVGASAIPATNEPADIEATRSLLIGDHACTAWPHCNTWYADPVVLGSYPESGLKLFGKDAPKVEPGDMETIRQPLDFYGFNTYTGDRIRAGKDGEPVRVGDTPGTPATQFRWPVRPESLYWGPKFLHERYQLPMYVMENGLASMDWVHADGHVKDTGRIDFITRYLSALARAIEEGTDVRGYFHWSLLDNFEWAEGYRMRFGLVHVDFESGQRIPKDSFEHYKSIIASGGSSLPKAAATLR